jgi:hypothetical protein
MFNKTRARVGAIAYLEGALLLAQDLVDGELEYLIERALDQARCAHVKSVERRAATVH